MRSSKRPAALAGKKIAALLRPRVVVCIKVFNDVTVHLRAMKKIAALPL